MSIGAGIFLFVIGLELDPKRLLSMRKEVFGGGSLQLAACGFALAGGLLALGLPWQAALVAGLALGLSSTAIAVQTMTERNELATPTGRSAFAVLLFQDIAAIQPLVHDAVKAVHLVGVAVDAVLNLLRRLLAEVMRLTCHRAEAADLPGRLRRAFRSEGKWLSDDHRARFSACCPGPPTSDRTRWRA